MSIQREVFRRLRWKWPAVLVIAASSISDLSLEAKASWFPQDAGVAPVESEAPATPNTDQAAVVEQEDEGNGSFESVDANAESAGVDANASGEESAESNPPRNPSRIRPPSVDVFRVPRERPREPSWEVRRRVSIFKWFLWGYPLFLAIHFARGSRADGKRPKMNVVLKMLSVGWLLCVIVLLITAKMS